MFRRDSKSQSLIRFHPCLCGFNQVNASCRIPQSPCERAYLFPFVSVHRLSPFVLCAFLRFPWSPFSYNPSDWLSVIISGFSLLPPVRILISCSLLGKLAAFRYWQVFVGAVLFISLGFLPPSVSLRASAFFVVLFSWFCRWLMSGCFRVPGFHLLSFDLTILYTRLRVYVNIFLRVDETFFLCYHVLGGDFYVEIQERYFEMFVRCGI